MDIWSVKDKWQKNKRAYIFFKSKIPHIWIDLEDADYLTHISGTGGFDTHHQQPVLAGSVGGDGIPSWSAEW